MYVSSKKILPGGSSVQVKAFSMIKSVPLISRVTLKSEIWLQVNLYLSEIFDCPGQLRVVLVYFEMELEFLLTLEL